MSNFTPGPWNIGKIVSESAPDIFISDAGSDHMLAVATAHGDDNNNAVANARLIAAAPALYEAAKATLDAFRSLRDLKPVLWDSAANPDICNAWDKLRTSIALVESTEPLGK